MVTKRRRKVITPKEYDFNVIYKIVSYGRLEVKASDRLVAIQRLHTMDSEALLKDCGVNKLDVMGCFQKGRGGDGQ